MLRNTITRSYFARSHNFKLNYQPKFFKTTPKYKYCVEQKTNLENKPDLYIYENNNKIKKYKWIKNTYNFFFDYTIDKYNTTRSILGAIVGGVAASILFSFHNLPYDEIVENSIYVAILSCATFYTLPMLPYVVLGLVIISGSIFLITFLPAYICRKFFAK